MSLPPRTYRVTFARPARKELERLRPPTVTRIFEAIEGLAEVPRPPGCVKLAGGGGEYRVRVGEYRVLYTVDDAAGVVDVMAIRHRREAYR